MTEQTALEQMALEQTALKQMALKQMTLEQMTLEQMTLEQMTLEQMAEETGDERSKKHVACFIPNLDGGGAERVMIHLSEGFVHRGWRVDFGGRPSYGCLCE